MSDDPMSDVKALIESAKGLPELTAEIAELNARLTRVEGFLGHVHAVVADAGQAFQEFPKAIGDAVAYTKEEELKLLAELKASK